MSSTVNLDLPDRFWKSRAEAAEAECNRLRLVIENLSDELSVRAEKIVQLDREVRRLRDEIT